MKRLKQWEKDILLLSLITPKKFARRILKRNKLMLQAIRDDKCDDFVGNIGCPHCIEVYTADTGCMSCRWYVVSRFSNCCGEGCLGFMFDGVPYDRADVYYEIKAETFKRSRCSKDTIKFLKAHVLWATRILDNTYSDYAHKHGIKKPRRVDGVWQQQD